MTAAARSEDLVHEPLPLVSTWRSRLIHSCIAVFLLLCLTSSPTRGTSQFVEITDEAGVGDSGFSYSAAWGDYDADGLQDLVVTYVDRPDILYRNLGNGTFENVSYQAGVHDNATSGAEGAIWGDYDNDGDLDLYIANGCEPAPDDPSALYRNNGNGTFTLVTNEAGLSYVGVTEGTAWADYDEDGFLDLYVGLLNRAVPNTGNFLYRNNRDGTFTNVGAEAGVNDTRDSNGGVAWADYDNDGDVDLYVANRNEPNALFRNDGDGKFEEVAGPAGVNDPANSEGVAWADYDNDGWLDLFVANLNAPSRLYRNNRNGTFTDVAPAASVNLPGASVGANWGDLDNDGWQDLFVVNLGGSAPNRLYRNNGNGTFTNVAAEAGVAYQEDGRVGAWADMDNDGFLDLFVSNRGKNRLFRNIGNANHWLVIRLAGVLANRDAIGARLEATATINGRLVRQLREVSAGASRHSQDSLPVEFGLGDAEEADLTITFPGGVPQHFGRVRANQVLVIREPVSDARMNLDLPANGPVDQPFTLAGWAIDRNAPVGTGVDAVHVWAYPSPGSGIPPMFVGAAPYGHPRADVGGVFGTRFADSGFHQTVRGLASGTYALVTYARSTVSGTFNRAATATVTVLPPTSIPLASIDAPGEGATVGPSFFAAGWALDFGAPTGTGVDAIHVYAFPDGGGAPTFLGVGAYGGLRGDVGAAFGAQFTNAGYFLNVSGLAPGAYQVVVYFRSTITGVFASRARRITVRPPGDPHMAVDTPANGSSPTRPFLLAGWAIDRDAPSGPGVDTLHVWAYPAGGAAPMFVGVPAYGGTRGDVGAIFGSRFTNSGYNLIVSSLPPGQYQLVVYARSTVTGTFNQVRVVTVTVF